MNQSAQPATDRATTTGCNNGSLEKVDCYRLAVEFAAVAATLVPRGHSSLRDQLERASTSVALNLSEGWGRWRARGKAQFYAIARGSLLESSAVIDLLRARGLAGEAECARARALCARVGQMLNGLIRAMERRASGRL
jgi:four helix bundle protein